MYAIIDIGSKQFKVEAGDILEVDSLGGNVGDKLDFNILFKPDSDAKDQKAKAEILSHGKGKKIVVFKYKAKKNIRKKKGHRQHLTKVKILSI